MKELLSTFFCLALFAHGLIAQEVKVSLELNKEQILIGEQVEATLMLEFPVTDTVSFPHLGDTLTGKVEIVSKKGIDTNYTGSNMSVKQLSQQFVITSFDSGYHAIPPIHISSSSGSVKTEPLLLSVSDVEVEMTEATQQGEMEIKDIKDIRDVDFSLWEWIKTNWYWLTGLVVFLLLLWAYFKYIHSRWKKKGRPALIPKKITPIHEIAFGRLAKLESQKLWQSGKVKEYHIELTDIIREYIEERFNVPALESTTEEIMEDIQEVIREDGIKTELNSFFVLADLVKFARHQPLPDENSRSMGQARSFVENTKPIPDKEPEKETIEQNV